MSYCLHMNKAKFLKTVNSPLQFKVFMILKLPIAFISGVRIKHVNEEEAVTKIKFKYINQNPFRSMYFACMAMAAEMSTGALAMAHISDYKASMLVQHMEVEFTKKAIGRIEFKCDQGNRLKACIEEAMNNPDGSKVTISSIGTDEKGDHVAHFKFTWTFKRKA